MQDMRDKQELFYSETSPDGFQVIVDVYPAYGMLYGQTISEESRKILDSAHKREAYLEERINSLDNEIERLTSHADGLDYAVAAASGVICAAIDSFFVGAFDLDGALERARSSDATEKVNSFVEKKANNIRVQEAIKANLKKKIEKEKRRGRTLTREEIEAFKDEIRKGVENKMLKLKDSDDIATGAVARAITKLEQHFPLPLDKIYEGSGISAAVHHLDDLAHHPTPLGLVAAFLGSFFRIGILTVKNNKIKGGKFNTRLIVKFDKKPDYSEWLKIVAPLFISGILTWLLNLAFKKKEEVNGSKLPKPVKNLILLIAQTPALVSVLKVINNWLGHLASDVAGSSTAAYKEKRGKGIPGFFLASLKELCSVYPLNKTGLPAVIEDLYDKEGLDLRMELGMLGDIGKSIGKQAVPVISGELVVRTFYFVRQLGEQLKGGRKLTDVDWKPVLPFRNRTVARMMTVESTVFTALDIADAAVRSAVSTGGPENPLFWKDLLLRINFVGIGRCTIAVFSDATMGIKRWALVYERLALKNQALENQNAKMFVYQEGMWNAAKNTAAAFGSLLRTKMEVEAFLRNSFSRVDEEWSDAVDGMYAVRALDPDFYDSAFGDF